MAYKHLNLPTVLKKLICEYIGNPYIEKRTKYWKNMINEEILKADKWKRYIYIYNNTCYTI